jgi:hypothetical protein
MAMAQLTWLTLRRMNTKDDQDTPILLIRTTILWNQMCVDARGGLIDMKREGLVVIVHPSMYLSI